MAKQFKKFSHTEKMGMFNRKFNVMTVGNKYIV